MTDSSPSHPAPGVIADAKIRSTGACILLMIVTLGFYSWYWWFKVHSDLQRQRDRGLGGGIALVLAIFISIVLVFLTPSEVGDACKDRGIQQRVSAVTGLWVLLPLVGMIVWFVKVNGAVNRYWESLGVRA
ncbi:DUF4234 domain-containing protein [Rudaeicoccus suwonensis]|uniref:Uncharacterized protein DUF4234 n=1 Tax=Rudaeicoccus suwonensis TaxID=657409 RepID=A0A561EC66_9MICO|nr:DUF4234 domain-containing protein [Rudaeicoccus suwonensis]TWE13208.1 uncharacterized protein DUF4234 [Rudaeicoccus suwonensis]